MEWKARHLAAIAQHLLRSVCCPCLIRELPARLPVLVRQIDATRVAALVEPQARLISNRVRFAAKIRLPRSRDCHRNWLSTFRAVCPECNQRRTLTGCIVLQILQVICVLHTTLIDLTAPTSFQASPCLERASALFPADWSRPSTAAPVSLVVAS